MGYLFNSLKEFMLPEDEKVISEMLGVEKKEISSVLQLLFGGILKVFSERGRSLEMESILNRAGGFNILSNVSDLFTEKPDPDIEIVSLFFLDILFEEKKDDFIELVRRESGSSSVIVNKLIILVSSLIMGFLGEKLISGISLTTLQKQVKSEEDDFKAPSGIEDILKSSALERWKKKYNKIGFKWIRFFFFFLMFFLIVNFFYNEKKYFLNVLSSSYRFTEKKQTDYIREDGYFTMEILMDYFFSDINLQRDPEAGRSKELFPGDYPFGLAVE